MESQVPTLIGNKCIITEWRSEFADGIVEHANNYKVWKNLLDAFPHPYNKQDAVSFIEFCRKEKRGQNFCICKLKDGVAPSKDIDFSQLEPIGGIGFKTNDIANLLHVSEIGYWLGEKYWGLGIMTEAIKLFVDYGFSEDFKKFNQNKRLERITAAIFSYNEVSGKVLNKNGFHLEATLRKQYVKEGKFVDGLLYVKLCEESE